MDGTRYVDGVLVDTSQLARTEASKAFHIMRDRLDNWENGIHSGLELTVNTVNTSRLDLTAGTGYAVNGEYVEVTADQLNTQIADNTLGAVNWVIAFYLETKTSPNPHETNGTIQSTESKRGFRLRVLTPAQFNALPLSDDTYALDAQDRALLVGIVTATGGALTAASIEQPMTWRSAKYAVVATPAMTGVVVYKVSDNTPNGTTGALKFDAVLSQLSWQAPGESGFGTPVAIIADGIYTLTALGGTSIQVIITVAAMPLSNSQVQVSIFGLYSQEVPRMSSTDRHHRSLQGTGVPSPSNPHGLSLDDISPGFDTDITTHQQLMHANGIWRGSSVSCLQVAIDESGNPDKLTITAPVGNDCYWVHGKRLTGIKNTVLPFTALTDKRALFEVYVDNVGNIKHSMRLEHTGTSLAGANNGIVYVNDAVLAGVHTISWISDGIGGGYLQWNTGGNGATQVRVNAGDSSGLYLLRSGKEEVWYYIANLAELPVAVGTHTDSVAVSAPVDRTENLAIAQVFWGGNSAGTLGYTNSRGTTPAKLADLRLFGTMDAGELRDDALRTLIEYPEDEHHANGVCVWRQDSESLSVTAGVGLTVKVNGQAPVYVRGKRHVVGSAAAPISVLLASSDGVTVIYVDIDGNVVQVSYLLAAFMFVNKPNAFDSSKYYKTLTASYAANPYVFTGTPLAIVVTAGGAITGITDMRRCLSGGNVTVQPWSVGRALPTEQSAEFFSLDAALVYAFAQGQEEITCFDAELSNTSISIPGSTRLKLTGSITLMGDWSASSRVFSSSTATVIFSHLKILLGVNFVGSSGLSLITGSPAHSRIVFDDVNMSWMTNGPIAVFPVGVSLGSALVVDGLQVSMSFGSTAPLFSVGSELAELKIHDVTIVQGDALAILYAAPGLALTADISHCTSTGAGAVVALEPTSSVEGSFFALRDFYEPLAAGTGTMTRAKWMSCSFVTIRAPRAYQCAIDACTVASSVNFGSAATPCDISLSNCYIGPLASTSTLFAGVTGGVAQVSNCFFKSDFQFGGTDIKVTSTTFAANCEHTGMYANNVVFSGCNIKTFLHTATFDFVDWKLIGCFVGRIKINWTTETVAHFVLSECSLTQEIELKATSAQSAVDIDGTIIGCNLDATVRVAFCRNVRILDNYFQCIADFTTPPMSIGEHHFTSGQDVQDVEVRGNVFKIERENTTALHIGAPVVLIANPGVPLHDMNGIRVVGNRFEWLDADVSQRVTCVMIVSDEVNNITVADNALVLAGHLGNTAWQTAEGTRSALRLALLLGFKDIGTDNHNCELKRATIRGNTFTVRGSALFGDKWICYDFGLPLALPLDSPIYPTENRSNVIGSTAVPAVPTARMCPIMPGAFAFLNDFTDNT